MSTNYVNLKQLDDIDFLKINNTNVMEDDDFERPEIKYLNLLVVLGICFFCTAYYLFLYKKQRIAQNTKLRENLAIAFIIRGLSIAYSIICLNSKEDNMPSFFNFILFQFSTLFFLTILIDYSEFLIEKVYYLKDKKSDIFLKKFFFILKLLYYGSFILTAIIFSSIQSYLEFDYFCFKINGFMCIFTSVLFLYYGISLAQFYSEGSLESIPHIDGGVDNKKAYKINLVKKLYVVSFTVGVSQFIVGSIYFIVGIKYFGVPYISFLHSNLFDFLSIIIGTFICGLVIGFIKISKTFISINYDEAGNDLKEKLLS